MVHRGWVGIRQFERAEVAAGRGGFVRPDGSVGWPLQLAGSGDAGPVPLPKGEMRRRDLAGPRSSEELFGLGWVSRAEPLAGYREKQVRSRLRLVCRKRTGRHLIYHRSRREYG